ncbi:hypothetical protein [Streptomyces sp. NPDC002889]|uniref:hypothetical protein n=1 Tax=Streptomyces sp. NPDC002889 TaxID=3364669 RepID=UPI00367FDE72
MSKKQREPSDDESTSRFKGSDQHGWSPDLNESSQDNPSARRSFHPETDAPGPVKSRRSSQGEKDASAAGTPVESDSRRGEEYSDKSKEPGHHDKGRRGRSQRPSGSKDSSAFTGVDPQDPPTEHSGR